jgi:OOP family OmpA-OmpF porin
MERSLHAIAGAMALIGATAANAQGYVGAGAGPARIDVDCAGATTCDKTSTGYKLYGGYQFGGGLAVEGVYFDWGKARAAASEIVDVEGVPTTITGSLKVRGDGFGVGVAYFFPVSPAWVPVVRAGIVRNTGKTTANLNSLSASDSFHNTTAYLGLGIGYKFTPNLAVTGEADFSKVKYGPSDKANTRLLSIGMRYNF